MADKTPSQQAKDWYDVQTKSDQAIVDNNYNGSKSTLPKYDWVFGAYPKQIEEGLKATHGRTVARELGGEAASSAPTQAQQDWVPKPSRVAKEVASLLEAQQDWTPGPSRPSQRGAAPPPQQDWVPGPSRPSGPARGAFPLQQDYIPPAPRQPSQYEQRPPGYVPPGRGEPGFVGALAPLPPPPSKIFTSAQEQQAAEQANLTQAARRQVEDQKKAKTFSEMVAKEEFAQAGTFDKAKMLMGGHLGAMGGPAAGGVIGGVGMAKAGIDSATSLVNMTNTFMDVTRELKMAKYAGTPLEEAQRRAAAESKIPVVGKLLAGLTELASSGWKAHYAIRDMAAKLHDTNMEWGRFSAGMRQVEATRTVKDIERSMKQGEALAPSAAALEASESLLKNAMLPYEMHRKRKQDIDAAKDLLDQAEDQLWADWGMAVTEFGEGSAQEEEAKEKIREIMRTRASVDKLDKTGKWEGSGTVGYEQTLPGFMDSVRKDEMAKRRRPDRFD